jgi:hypothetical protein
VCEEFLTKFSSTDRTDTRVVHIHSMPSMFGSANSCNWILWVEVGMACLFEEFHTKKLLQLIMRLLCLVVPILVARLAGSKWASQSCDDPSVSCWTTFSEWLDVPISSSAQTER